VRRLLLDTQALIWWDANDPRLGGRARALLQETADVYVSAASAWEIAIKAALGKLVTTRPTSRVLAENRFLELPVSVEHAEAVAGLPRLHDDPFDRLLVATCRVEQLPILTSDPRFAQYGVEAIDATR
jgi:PIN domain nuclease of toxin-antitoxin system